ncbi:DUF3168 domain-containing protein [Methylobacterium tarhaniae]|uniref:DUF3168 domain-containing protein n=1 Tax=Methylobacterium tarhaniae TaxID=1187852 RepID=UPI003D07217E
MASRDFSDALTSAAMLALANDPGVVAIVGDRVRDYVETKPQWPFLRLDPVTVTPWEASCWVGMEADLVVHSFVRADRSTRGVQRLNAAVVAALDEAALPLSEGVLLGLDHRGSTTGPDTAEPASWHGIVRFRALVVEVTG